MNIENPKLKTRLSLNLLSLLYDARHRLRRQRFTHCKPAVAGLMLALLAFTQSVRAAEPLATWTPRVSPYGTTNNWRAIAFGNGKFVVVNQSAGLVITSTNGTDWQPHSANTNKALYGLAFGDNEFVAAGASGLIMTSTDGTSWQPRSSGTAAHLYHVNYGNGQFVAVGDSGTIVTSPDGITWTLRNTGTTNRWSASASGNGKNVIIGYRTESGTSYTRSAASPGFTDWDVRDTGLTFYLSGIAFGQGQFVAVGYAGILQTSTDGINWTPGNSSVSRWLYEVAFANDSFVAIGENIIITSSNGISWQPRYTQTGKTLQGLVFGANTWVVVGNDGVILQSDPVSAAPETVFLSDAQRIGTDFSFKLNGSVGQSYQIQTSTNLTDWSNLTVITCTNSPTSCTLTGQNGSRRYYRALRL